MVDRGRRGCHASRRIKLELWPVGPVARWVARNRAMAATSYSLFLVLFSIY